MIAEYIKAALRRAKYELMENGRWFASIPVCPGCWAEGEEVESCRDELESVLEDWILIKVRHGDEIPVIDGHDLNPQPVHAEAC
jgi:predicted RNase H-like HicB family nuclease